MPYSNMDTERKAEGVHHQDDVTFIFSKYIERQILHPEKGPFNLRWNPILLSRWIGGTMRSFTVNLYLENQRILLKEGRA